MSWLYEAYLKGALLQLEAEYSQTPVSAQLTVPAYNYFLWVPCLAAMLGKPYTL